MDAIAACAMGIAAAFAQPPSLAAYGRLPAMDHVALSASGKSFAFVATVGGMRKLFVRTVAGQPLAVASVEGVKVRDVSWVGDEYVVVATSDHYDTRLVFGRDYEFSRLIALDVNTRETRSLLGRGRSVDVVLGHYGYARDGGGWSAYLGTLRTTTDRVGAYLEDYDEDLVRVDLASGKQRQVVAGLGRGDGWLVGADGAVLANARYDVKRKEWTLYAGSRQGRLVASDSDPYHEDAVVGAGRTPHTALYVTTDDEGSAHYYEATVDDVPRAPVELFADVDELDGLIWRKDTRLLAGFVRGGDVPQPVLFDPNLQKRIDGTRKAFPGLRVRFESWTDDFDHMIVHTEGPQDSGTYWIVDIPSGTAEELGSDYPGVPGSRVGRVEVVEYQAADGMKLFGLLTLPPGREPRDLPLVVMPHGGPEARDHPTFDWWAQAHASRGYAVWQPNFRGSSGYGVAYRNAGYGEWGGKMQTDVSDGVAALAARGIVDPKRACIVGASYGGYAALAGVTLQNGLYRCAASFAGVSDLRSRVREDKERLGDAAVRYRLRYLGGANAWDKVLDERSPSRLAARADAPVLLIHGRDDTVVPFEQSRIMRKALESADKPVEMMELDGEDHWLSREGTRIAMLDRIQAFVERHNPP
ncbi:MAG TPA: prolyl oligopeptidase family serine peptidase [Nevskiaceae bacterium]|nr:prolyl oligopeptidase family serine peptidase [Nevskiaceae bacterium]